MIEKTGLVLEGGALRGIFTAGVLDVLLEHEYAFPYVVGVSAGSGNAVNYVAKQIGRTKLLLLHEDADTFYGLPQFMENRQILNLDRLVVEYALKEYPFDFDTFNASKTACESVMVNCLTGKTEYHSMHDSREKFFLYNKASCAVPFVCEPVEIDNQFYLDGSLYDSIPFERAMDQGCDKVVVVLTKPEGGQATDYSKFKAIIERCYGEKYPKLCETMIRRKAEYDRQVEKLALLEREGKAFVIRPKSRTIGHFESNAEKLIGCYEDGREMMKERLAEFKQFIAK